MCEESRAQGLRNVQTVWKQFLLDLEEMEVAYRAPNLRDDITHSSFISP